MNWQSRLGTIKPGDVVMLNPDSDKTDWGYVPSPVQYKEKYTVFVEDNFVYPFSLNHNWSVSASFLKQHFIRVG
jgi:hypothetical protein